MQQLKPLRPPTTSLVLSATLLLPLAAGAVTNVPPTTITHRFLLEDESRAQLLYVDQREPAKNWAIKFPDRYRDYQLIGGNKVMLSTGAGYREYSLDTKQMTKEVNGFAAITFARRRADGSTVIGGNADGITVLELGPDDQVRRKANFKLNQVRLGRLTPQGTVLFGSDNKLVEANLDGQVLKEYTVESCQHLYQALRTAAGHLLAATGYGASLVELDADGKVVRRFGGKDAPEARDLGYNFFAGFQVLKNGNIVVSNWTGHGAQDSVKGVQLVEFDPAGKVGWTWHDPALAGSIHGVIVLDDVDCSVLNDDASSVLGAAGSLR